MKALKLSGSLRESVGKKDAKKLRREGRVPCVLYGGKDQVQLSILEKDFKPLVFSPHTHLVEIDIDGKIYRCVLQDIQYHPVTDHILHVDFLQIFDDKPVTVSIPLEYTGVSKGVLKGGRLFRKYRKLKVNGLPGDLPDAIVVDITKLNINDSIKIEDLKRPNLTFFDPPKSVAVSIKSARAVDAGSEEGEEEEETTEAPAEGGDDAAKTE